MYHKGRSTGMGNHSHRWTETYEYCILCYTDAKVNDEVGAGAYFGKIFMIGFGIVWIIMTSSFVPFMSIVGLASIIFGIISLVRGPQRAEELISKRQDFLNSFNYDKGITRISKLKRKTQIQSIQVHCMECGESIILKDKYCQNCGDTTKDERAIFEQ
jgi:hypothetical protein